MIMLLIYLLKVHLEKQKKSKLKKCSSKTKNFKKTKEINNRKGFNFNSEANKVSCTLFRIFYKIIRTLL